MAIPDNYSQFLEREKEHESWLAKRPVCYYCGEHIQDEFAYNINGELICPDCLNREFRVYVEDFTE